MATIRRSGSGWQALIRKKKYQGQTSKTFSSKAAAKLWANAVESSLKTPAKLDLKPPQIFREAIDLYIQGPLQDHRSRSNEQYPLKAIDVQTFNPKLSSFFMAKIRKKSDHLYEK